MEQDDRIRSSSQKRLSVEMKGSSVGLQNSALVVATGVKTNVLRIPRPARKFRLFPTQCRVSAKAATATGKGYECYRLRRGSGGGSAETRACRIKLDRPSGYDGVVHAPSVSEHLLAVPFLEARQHGQARENCEGSEEG